MALLAGSMFVPHVEEVCGSSKTLYGSMRNERAQTCMGQGWIWPDRSNTYTGLRETSQAAFERMQQAENWEVQTDGVMVFAVKFSLQGWMHVTTKMVGTVPLLQRMSYPEGIDYGVWHFNAAMPLRCSTPDGDWLYEVIFHPGA